MKNALIALTTILLSLSVTSKSVLAENKPATQAPNTVVNIPDSKNRIIRLTDRGLVPPNLTMDREDSIVFFVNDSTESLATLEIDFGDKPTHCGSANLRTGDDGKVRSTRPFGPSDFSSTCFHASGTYPVKIFGLKSNPQGVQTTIKVN